MVSLELEGVVAIAVSRIVTKHLKVPVLASFVKTPVLLVAGTGTFTRKFFFLERPKPVTFVSPKLLVLVQLIYLPQC